MTNFPYELEIVSKEMIEKENKELKERYLLAHRILEKLEQLLKKIDDFEAYYDEVTEEKLKCEKCHYTTHPRADLNYCSKCGTKLILIPKADKHAEAEEFIKNFFKEFRNMFLDEGISPEIIIKEFLKNNGFSKFKQMIEFLPFSDLKELIEMCIDGIKYVNSKQGKFFIENFYVP